MGQGKGLAFLIDLHLLKGVILFQKLWKLRSFLNSVVFFGRHPSSQCDFVDLLLPMLHLWY
jgi:hypothetical protein